MTDLLLILPKSLQNGEDTPETGEEKMTDLRMVGATPPTPYRTGEVDRKMVCRASSFLLVFVTHLAIASPAATRRITGDPVVKSVTKTSRFFDSESQRIYWFS